MKTLNELKQQLTKQQNRHFEIEILLRRIVYLFKQSEKDINLLKKAIRQEKRIERKTRRQIQRLAKQTARENRRAAKSNLN